MMTSTMTSEPRVRREARTLSQNGVGVVALGIRSEGDEARRELVDGLEIRRIDLLDMWMIRRLRRLAGRRPSRRSPASPSRPTASAAHAPVESSWDPVADVRNLGHWLVAFVAFLWHGRRLRADVLHPHDIPPLAAALLLTRGRARLVYEAHECWAEKFPTQPLSRRLGLRLERIACRRGDLVIAVNDSIADRMASDHACGRPLTVLNVADVEPVEDITMAPAEQPLQILYHGIVVPGRGVELLVEAVARMQQPAELVVRGRGEALGGLAERSAALGIDDRVKLVPPVPLDEVVSAASCSHVGVMPFEDRLGYEFALPNKLFEYLAAGLAVVASDLPELRRLIVAEDVGEIVAAGDVDGLARALDRFASDRDLLASCRRRALAAASSSYTWSVHQRVLVEAYAPLLRSEDR